MEDDAYASIASVTRSPRLAAIGVATLSGLTFIALDTNTTVFENWICIRNNGSGNRGIL